MSSPASALDAQVPAGPPATGRRWPPMAALYAAVMALGGWAVGLRRLEDNSFLWHLRTGQWILDHGRVPRGDLYSYTVPGHAWVAQSWLAEVVYAGVDRAVGAQGVRLLTALMGACVGLAAYRLAHRICGRRIVAAGLCVPALACSATTWVSRPLLFGLCALVALVWIVEVPSSWMGRRAVVSVPVVMWLWANVHGTFVLGLVYLGLHLAGSWVDGRPPWRGRERALVWAGTAGFAVCFVNPYGWRLVWFPFALLGRGEILSHIGEWQSPAFRSELGILLGAWMVVLVAVLSRASRRPPWRDLLISAAFVGLALWAQRNTLLAPVVGLPVLARAVARRSGERADRSRINAALLAGVVLLGSLVTVRQLSSPAFDLRSYPVAAMRAVKARGLLGHRLLTTDAWAGYVIRTYWPRQRVFLDDRYDMYPESLTQEFFDVQAGRPDWSSVLAAHGVDVVVWKPADPLPQLLSIVPGWTRIYQDDVAVVLVRNTG
jgi:hypothetical protein